MLCFLNNRLIWKILLKGSKLKLKNYENNQKNYSVRLDGGAGAATVSGIISLAQGWVNAILPLLVGIAVLVLIVGIIRYITAGEDEEKRGKARNLMIYGIIGLFVMVSMWGLVFFLGSTFSISREAIDLPNLIP